MRHEDITEKIIASYYEVYNRLGYGFLETVYEKAMLIELGKRGLSAIPQCPINVVYDEEIIGEYFADLMVENRVIVELKATRQLSEQHEAQLLNYLKATNVEVGLLLNFGPKTAIKRKVFSNERK